MHRAIAAAITASTVLLTSFVVVSPAVAAPEGTPVPPSTLLAELRVEAPSPVAYNRALFAEGIDADGDGCNTRREVLQAESLVPVTVVGACDITLGEWYSWYDGVTWTDPAQLEMDHLVALKEAWHAGAHAWTNQQRSDYANDLDIEATLTVVTGSVNGAKSHYDPTSWLPSQTGARCQYVSDWITVKYRWNLSVDVAEKAALQSVVDQYCGGVTIVVPPVRTDVPTPTPVPEPTPGGGVKPLPAGTHRLAGADRYATAAKIALRFNAGVPVAYIATGANYPDALSASAVAGAQGAPLLLVPTSSIPQVVWNALVELQPEKIIIAGGAGVVSESVAAALAKVAPVERASGPDRYATSRALISGAPLGSPTAFVATGRNFPDALTAGAAAGAKGGAVLLVDGLAKSVPTSSKNVLKSKGVSTVRIAGAASVVTAGVQANLAASFPSVARHGGADRYATGVAINAAVFPSADTVYLAVGTNYADALAGGALAAATDSPLFIVQQNCVPKSVRDRIVSMSPSTMVLLGSTGALSNAVASLTECAPPPPPPAPKPTPAPPAPPARPADVDCADFGTWSAAQAWFRKYYPYYGDVARLDADNDGIACEALPGAP